MKKPSIKQARALCTDLGARGLIIIALYEDDLAAASYGETKKECRQTAYTTDRIIEAIEEGEIPVWEGAEVIPQSCDTEATTRTWENWPYLCPDDEAPQGCDTETDECPECGCPNQCCICGDREGLVNPPEKEYP